MEHLPQPLRDESAAASSQETMPQKPKVPLQVMIPALIVAGCMGLWTYLLVSYLVWVVTGPLQHVSWRESETYLMFKEQFPVVFLMLATAVLIVLHVVMVIAYVRGHKWAAYMLTISLLLGVLCSLILLLLAGMMMAGLNGAAPEEVEFLLNSNSSPLYMPLYLGMPYLIVSVLALALIWSRPGRKYVRARTLWRAQSRAYVLPF